MVLPRSDTKVSFFERISKGNTLIKNPSDRNTHPDLFYVPVRGFPLVFSCGGAAISTMAASEGENWTGGRVLSLDPLPAGVGSATGPFRFFVDRVPT